MSLILECDVNVFLTTESARPQVKRQKRLFVICDDCYWCASALSERYFDAVTCPMCNKGVSSIPISRDEYYYYNYTPNRGIELEFFSNGYGRR